MNELKPCPFCGGEAYPDGQSNPNRTTSIYIECNRCGINTIGFNTEEQAIKAWNRRVKDE